MKITVEFDVSLSPSTDEAKVREGFRQYLIEMDVVEGAEGPGDHSAWWVADAKVVPDSDAVEGIAHSAIGLAQESEGYTRTEANQLSNQLDLLFGREPTWTEDGEEELEILRDFGTAEERAKYASPERELFLDEREPCADDLLRD